MLVCTCLASRDNFRPPGEVARQAFTEMSKQYLSNQMRIDRRPVLSIRPNPFALPEVSVQHPAAARSPATQCRITELVATSKICRDPNSPLH